ncbi:MAG: hypothetical protein IPK82_43235 [Polyangiaceae bacterium]|nr:hypothetical protein [Polyangiaceae bacterium]
MSRPSPFTHADAVGLLRRLGPNDELILVGGQALNFWAERYVAHLEALKELGPFTSKDLDFCGTRKDAENVARRLGGRFVAPSFDDATPCTGKVVVFFANEEREIDFVNIPHGIDPIKFLASVILVEIEPGLRLRVMHPAHCMMSRIANLLDFRRDDPSALRQLRVSVHCARMYTDELAASNSRAALHQNETTFRYCLTQRALTIVDRTGVDPFDAISTAPALPARFHFRRYPQMRALLDQKRSARARARGGPPARAQRTQ